MSDIEQPPEACVISINADGLEETLLEVFENALVKAMDRFDCDDPSPDGEL